MDVRVTVTDWDRVCNNNNNEIKESSLPSSAIKESRRFIGSASASYICDVFYNLFFSKKADFL